MPSRLRNSAGALSLTALSQRLTNSDATELIRGSNRDAAFNAAQIRLGGGDVYPEFIEDPRELLRGGGFWIRLQG